MKFICVKCGGNATEGSMKHPCCKMCFKKVWNNDTNKFLAWLSKLHF